MTNFAIAVALVLTLAPSSARAQGCQRSSPYADEDLAATAPLFYDSARADVRGTAIEQLTAADTQYVVRSDSVCRIVVEAAVAELRRSNDLWAAGREGDYAATVFRFGPYYAVALLEERAPVKYESGMLTGFMTGRSPLLIYRATDLELLLRLH